MKAVCTEEVFTGERWHTQKRPCGKTAKYDPIDGQPTRCGIHRAKCGYYSQATKYRACRQPATCEPDSNGYNTRCAEHTPEKVAAAEAVAEAAEAERLERNRLMPESLWAWKGDIFVDWSATEVEGATEYIRRDVADKMVKDAKGGG